MSDTGHVFDRSVCPTYIQDIRFEEEKEMRLTLTKPRMWNPPTPEKRCWYNKNQPRSRNTNSINENENESNKRKRKQGGEERISQQIIPYSSNKQGRLSVT